MGRGVEGIDFRFVGSGVTQDTGRGSMSALGPKLAPNHET